MNRCILYTDLSPNFTTNFTVLHNNADFLKSRKLALAPPLWWPHAKVKCHELIWQGAKVFAEQGHVPLSLQDWYAQFDTYAGKDETLVLYGHTLSSEVQVNFIRQLQSLNELQSPRSIQAVLLFGRPTYLVEKAYRLYWPKMVATEDALSMARRFVRYSDCFLAVRNELGAENVTVRFDFTHTVEAQAQHSLPEIFPLSNEDAPQAFEPPSPHVLQLASREARHILSLCEVGRFVLPEHAHKECLGLLKKLEEEYHWDTTPLSPPEIRQALIQACEEQEPLWHELGVSGEQLKAPESLLPEKSWAPYAGLTDAHIESFWEALPETVSEVLLERFSIFRNFLSPEQERFVAQSGIRKTHFTFVPQKNIPVVSVLTMAYNQEAYIAQCMESVLEQETDFPVQHLVLDHCSRDGTQDIIAEYALRHPSIRPLLLSSRIPGQNVHALFSRCRSEFAALCDGDDYFTDPHKLQQQVDLMRSNPECSLCFHPVRVLYEDEPDRVRSYPPLEVLPRGVRPFYYLSDLVKFNFIQTNSALYRWRFTEGIPDWFRADLCPGDWYWHLLHAERGKIGFINKEMSVYRRHKGGVYYLAEVDRLKHRFTTGWAEINTYDAVNSHFESKFFDLFANLADGVIADMTIYVHNNPECGWTMEGYHEEVAQKYPKFMAHLLQRMTGSGGNAKG